MGRLSVCQLGPPSSPSISKVAFAVRFSVSLRFLLPLAAWHLQHRCNKVRGAKASAVSLLTVLFLSLAPSFKFDTSLPPLGRQKVRTPRGGTYGVMRGDDQSILSVQ